MTSYEQSRAELSKTDRKKKRRQDSLPENSQYIRVNRVDKTKTAKQTEQQCRAEQTLH